MASGGFKASIAPVPTADEFLDIVLSRTQRKTPTVVHPGWKITRIRSFYSRKVAFTRDAFTEKLDTILSEFPVLDNLHPFLSSLMNVLYDRNHLKLALGQLNTARHLIDQVAKDYVRLIKFGDSLYRCKQLKRAALGRMATIMRRQKDPLAYLEQVRQHMSRLPSIDPNTRTLLICGYPNVGKSSFINKITRADVDVQPYAFTTKSLFVGHMDYKYLRWQVIDTPGILDHPLEEMNTIEMQSITAMAHLRAAILYFMDLSEQCGYTVEAQCKLYHSIKPLFAAKPTLLVLNKADVTRLADLSPERRALVEEITNASDTTVQVAETSTFTMEGVIELRNLACDTLLASRVDTKMKGNKINTVINRIHVAQPAKRDDVERKPFIPEAVLARRKYDQNDPNKRRLEKDEQEEQGGAGVHNIDLKKNYMLENEEWKYDIIPEVWEGKNVADFVDPDILEKLEALEREEERLEAEGFYASDDEIEDDEEEALRSQAADVRASKAKAKALSQDIKKQKNRAVIPRKMQSRSLTQMSERLTQLGIDPSRVTERATALAKAKGLTGKRKRLDDEEGMDVDEADEDAWEDEDDSMAVEGVAASRHAPRKKRLSNSGTATAVGSSKRVPGTNRQAAGMRDAAQHSKAVRLHDLSLRTRNMHAKAGESDRVIKEKMPKWLYTGKRKAGKTNRR